MPLTIFNMKIFFNNSDIGFSVEKKLRTLNNKLISKTKSEKNSQHCQNLLHCVLFGFSFQTSKLAATKPFYINSVETCDSSNLGKRRSHNTDNHEILIFTSLS